MKKKIFFLLFFYSFQLFGMGITFYEPILKQLQSDLDTKTIKSIDELSPELRKRFSDFIKSKLQLQQKHAPLSQ